MTDTRQHPPKPYRFEDECVVGPGIGGWNVAMPDSRDVRDIANAVAAHYESVLTEYRDALRELVEAVADNKSLNILRTFEAMQAARQLLEGENNE